MKNKKSVVFDRHMDYSWTTIEERLELGDIKSYIGGYFLEPEGETLIEEDNKHPGIYNIYNLTYEEVIVEYYRIVFEDSVYKFQEGSRNNLKK